MTTQIAVRLPDDIVAFMDELVTGGHEPSRAAVVTKALDRTRRQAAAERDARIYAASQEPSDLDELIAWVSAHPADLDG